MSVTFKIEGLKELDAALGELPKATARNVLKRVLTRAGQPIAEEAKRLVPVVSGELKDSIQVSTKARNTVGKQEYAEAMQAGLGQDAAVAALRTARRNAGGDASFMELYVGPISLPYAHMVEFGSIHNRAHPYMRPAWDAKKGEALAIITQDMGAEIAKAAARAAAKLLKAGSKA